MSRKARNHIIKELPEYFRAAKEGRKRFEIRRDDRDYQIGDTLQLAEFDGTGFTGNFMEVKLEYVLRDCPQYGLMPGYCIFGW